ncbi:AEC family transporter [Inmirania thermothiophila]|uniref:AEC family transporter n=1 Tax=Inmirania thermothiophila TaxID=1750597 RepID=A0A3N1Y6W0_9GAMM|nr:AEC family transporter [Inmirania thermothiophila]ROR34258.1 hypothetical protein EDC57_0154 [Inmirania thermothiophila]
MSAALAALLPLFLVIALGHLLRRAGFPGEGFWRPAERLTYYVLFPALLVLSLSRAELEGAGAARMAGALAAGVLAMTALLLVLRPRLGVPGPAFTSLYQGAVRFNTYVGLAATAALLGEAGLGLAAVALAVLVPLVNLLSVTLLARYGSGGIGLVRAVAGNPLILACAAGIGLRLAEVAPPAAAATLLELLGRAALPLGLLAVGAGLDFAAVRQRPGLLALGLAAKLALMPALVFAACRLLAVPEPASLVAVLFAALPGAPSAYVLARQLGGDGALMAGLVTGQTAAAVLTLPLVLGLAG